MKTIKQYLLVLLSAVLLFSSCSDDKKTTSEKSNDAVLLVTFGSSFPDPQKTFSKMENQLQERFPNAEMKWAYTADFIINKLAKRLRNGEEGGLDIDTPIEALNKFKKEGYKKITVQSLHVIPGKEFTDLTKIVADFAKANPEISLVLGTPLMKEESDVKNLAKVLVKELGEFTKAENSAVILMGHGTSHKNNDRYARLQKAITLENPLFFIGVVEDDTEPSFDTVLKLLKEKGITSVTLTPLMSIAGDHANNDMADKKDEGSWYYRLDKAGIKINIILKGLGDYPEVVKIWGNHLEVAKNK